MVFITLIVASLFAAVLGLRLRAWWLCLVAAVLAFPVALVANVDYGGLLLLPCVLLAVTVALRWSVGPWGWAGLVLAAVGIWFVGAASPFLLHWPTAVYWVLLLGILSGVLGLLWPRAPWVASKARANPRS